MNEEIVDRLFQNDDILQEQFKKEIDELIYYNIKQEILYAYTYKEGRWVQTFVLTDCSRRWVEMIHEADGTTVERFLTELRRGARQAELVCRFEENGLYSWYFTFLKVMDCANEEKDFPETDCHGVSKELVTGK